MELAAKLGIGTVQFGLDYGISNTTGKTAPDEVRSILDFAAANGIDTLDTAAAYGNAENVVGAYHQNRFNIISKYISDGTPDGVHSLINESMRRLGVASLYAYLAHRPANLIENTSEWSILGELKSKGTILHRGVSLNSPSELEALLDLGIIPDLVQVPYNYLDRRFEPLLIELKKRNCEIHTRSVFLQGLFFRDPDTLPDFFNPIKPAVKKVQAHEDQMSGSLLKFVLQKPFVDKVILGIENVAQLQQNLHDLLVAKVLPEIEHEFPEHILMPSKWPVN